ncbi:hypothetical protein J3R82DRAFT_6990, partial [Butyriboletus roseoflavus]
LTPTILLLPCKNCKSNANKHLSLPDLPQKRRSPDKKRIDNVALEKAHAKKAATMNKAIEKVGHLEDNMEAIQTSMNTTTQPIQP